MIQPVSTTSRPPSLVHFPPAAPLGGGHLNAPLLETEQEGKVTSALLSSLPGPNLSFFQPPGPPSLRGGLNAPLLETEQKGRVTSALFSSLMGPNPRAFPAPVPPMFARQETTAPFANGPIAAAGVSLPPAGAALLETEQAARTDSTLLSGLMGLTVGESRASAFGPSMLVQSPLTTEPFEHSLRIAREAYRSEADAQRAFSSAEGAARTREWFA